MSKSKCPENLVAFIGTMTDAELADRAGVTSYHARRWRLEAGKKPHRQWRHKKPTPEKEFRPKEVERVGARAYEMRWDAMSWDEIGLLLGKKKEAIRKLARRFADRTGQRWPDCEDLRRIRWVKQGQLYYYYAVENSCTLSETALRLGESVQTVRRCGREFAEENKLEWPPPREERGEQVYNLRKQRMPWEEIRVALGFNWKSNAIECGRLWARRKGVVWPPYDGHKARWAKE